MEHRPDSGRKFPGERDDVLASAVLLADYETRKHHGLLTLGDRPRLERGRVGSGRVARGDWVAGWFRGRPSHFLAVYWTPGHMWLGDRDGVHELHPQAGLERVEWSAAHAFAELLVTRGDQAVLRYKYRRMLGQRPQDAEFPDHDLPRWLARHWNDPETGFGMELRDGGLWPATWAD